MGNQGAMALEILNTMGINTVKQHNKVNTSSRISRNKLTRKIRSKA